MPISCGIVDAHPLPARRLVVLVSGAGSNLQALLDATTDPAFGAEVVAVGADRGQIVALERAERAGVPTFVLRTSPTATHGTARSPAPSTATHPTSWSLPAS